SVSWNLGQSVEDETYIDGAKSSMRGIGVAARYYYNRTFGVNLSLSKYEKRQFTDAGGTVHTIPDDVSKGITFIYRFAMNWNFYFDRSESQAAVLDQNWRNGSSWNFNIQYLW
ncbi:MAG: hypothetical protein DMD49_04035, partial [Gemmatimonadetes bacterium]